MKIFSTVKPFIDPEEEYELEALGINICISDNGLALFLLVRFFQLEPIRIEGDHLYFNVDELLDDAEELYRVPRSAWRSEPPLGTSDAELLIEAAVEDFARQLDLKEGVKILRGEEHPRIDAFSVFLPNGVSC